MADRSFTITIETDEEGRSALLTLLTPMNIGRAVRDYIQESMAPGQGMSFRVIVSDEVRSQTLEGVIPSIEEIRERIESRRREAEQSGE